MQAEVKILVEGYTNADSKIKGTEEEKTRPTVSLVKDGNIVMVVDPGVLESQQVLIDALQKEGLGVKDVNIVCITHSHIDHYRNIGMFPEAKTLEFFGLWSKNTTEDWQEQFSKNIKVLKTPGHDYTSITLFVTTKDGVIAVCGDVFWKENYPKKDVYASDLRKLEKSRELVLEMADWVVPGHGRMYKVKK
jgi:glyoxylase-like metal-dependent hydrolase (beta-lactamase superfamily II)